MAKQLVDNCGCCCRAELQVHPSHMTNTCPEQEQQLPSMMYTFTMMVSAALSLYSIAGIGMPMQETPHASAEA